jgi:UDP-glucose 4-epimerase
MAKALITGGAGFVGSHLADGLVARGDEVTLLDDLSTGRRENVSHLIDSGDAQLVEDSVLDLALVNELMAEADICFHLASAVGVQLVVDRPLDSLLRNMRGVDIVTEAACTHETRLVFTSTSEIYGKLSDGALAEGSDRLVGTPAKSRWTYSTAKVLGEMLAYGYHREHDAETVVVRLFNTVGPRQTGAYGMVVPRLVGQAIAGEDLTVYGDGLQSRCFTHVGDVVEAIVGVADEDAALGGVFNIGRDDEVTILELANLIIERTESPSQIQLVPYEEAYGEGFEELGKRRPDTTAIATLTGWTATRGLEAIIDDVVDYQRRQSDAGRDVESELDVDVH